MDIFKMSKFKKFDKSFLKKKHTKTRIFILLA